MTVCCHCPRTPEETWSSAMREPLSVNQHRTTSQNPCKFDNVFIGHASRVFYKTFHRNIDMVLKSWMTLGTSSVGTSLKKMFFGLPNLSYHAARSGLGMGSLHTGQHQLCIQLMNLVIHLFYPLSWLHPLVL